MNSRYFFKLFFLLAVFIIVSFSQCIPEDDDSIDQRDKFLGNWNCTETASQNPNPITFTVNITKDELTENDIYISNFYHLGFDEKTKVLVNYNSLNVPSQVVCGMSINGSGTYSQNKINMLYYVNDGADIDTVNAVFSR